jgi:XTP/dITP diphosphohydrolase
MPAPPRRLVLATGNPGKLAEFRGLLSEFPFELTSLRELGVDSPEETGLSFLENATLKARHAARASGHAALADDSGLEVEALDGAPGVYSARFAGPHANDAANNAKLIAALRAIDPQHAREPWRARYRSVLVLLQHAEDPTPLVAEGVWEGAIVAAPRGSGGFGYDPHFWLAQRGLTAAQLELEQKNRLSHRGAAMRALQEKLRAPQDEL